MTRWKAFAYHVLGSAIVLLLVFALVRWIWFPGSLFVASRGINLLGIIIPVDLVLGPLITLIIFNPLKKSLSVLKRDLTLIFLVQIGFLLYGVFMIYSARPVYMALVDKQFFVVTANEIEPNAQQKAKNPHFQQQPKFGPELVSIQLPDDKNLREDLSFANAAFGVGAQNLPEYYVPYEKRQGLAAASDADKLQGIAQKDRLRLQNFAEEQKKLGVSVSFIHMYAKQGKIFAAIDAKNGAIVEIL
mgnify:CR=1 FL=1